MNPLDPKTEPAARTPPALSRIPIDVLRALSPAQQEALAKAILPPPGSHRVDMRASIPLFGRRYYLTVLAGRERRSMDRLAREGQLDARRMLAVYALLLCALIAPIVVLLGMSFIAARLLGIEGLEPPLLALHEFFHRM